jgi:hypothetical protein
MGARLEPLVGACDLSGAGGTAVATISSLLSEHVTLQVRSVDRISLAGYVPRLQCDGQPERFLNERAGGTIPSPAMLGKIGRAYVEEVNQFAGAHEIPVVRFAKGDVKEDVAWPQMHEAERHGRSGVVFLRFCGHLSVDRVAAQASFQFDV